VGGPAEAGPHVPSVNDALQLFVDRTITPIGELLIVADRDGRLRATEWTDIASASFQAGAAVDAVQKQLQRRYGVSVVLERAKNPGGLTAAIDAYFAGDCAAIDFLPAEPAGTPFQRAVWSSLRTIACGTTISYAELARRIGRPSAVRAVGLANGSNPVCIVVPCHRVIGSNGTLTGYGGGLDRKRWLLRHEGRTAPLFT
jgi:methylated-DNA-[protein]-cysteine S-methyltransferase